MSISDSRLSSFDAYCAFVARHAYWTAPTIGSVFPPSILLATPTRPIFPANAEP
jgi:hypothetical protein